MSCVNKRAARTFLLDYAARTRAKKFDRVAASVYDELESKLRDLMRKKIDSHPSLGTTIK